MVLLSGRSKGLGSQHPQETSWTDKRFPGEAQVTGTTEVFPEV